MLAVICSLSSPKFIWLSVHFNYYMSAALWQWRNCSGRYLAYLLSCQSLHVTKIFKFQGCQWRKFCYILSNKGLGASMVVSRTDWALGNNTWMDTFGDVVVDFLNLYSVYYRYQVWQCSASSTGAGRPFRILNYLASQQKSGKLEKGRRCRYWE